MAQTRRRVSSRHPNGARALLDLAERVTSKRGGREALERLAEADDSEVSLAAIELPEHVGVLAFFDPTRFADRSSVRAFVRSTEFAAYMAVACHTLIGGTAVPEQSGPVSEELLERAREALHDVLADLGTLAAIAAQGEGGPIAFSDPEFGNLTTRVSQLAALARVAASLACEGAPPSRWQPIYDALSKATSGEDAPSR